MDNVWNKNAKHWSYVKEPLKPSFEDNAIMLSFLKKDKKTILLLGITQEITHLPWSKETKLFAADNNEFMIKTNYIKNENIEEILLIESWDKLSMENNSIDYILGDGSLNALPSLSLYKNIFKELSRVLKKNGEIILRLFISPNKKQTKEEIINNIKDKKIISFHSLKWEIAMMIRNEKEEVKVENIRNYFNEMFPNRKELHNLTNWDINEINTIDSYENSSNIYTFPTLSNFTEILKETDFEIKKIKIPTYSFGEKYPTILLGRKND